MQAAGEFNRVFLDPRARWTWIGTGAIGGKAAGLVAIDEILSSSFGSGSSGRIDVCIPTFAVIRTDVYDAFISRNMLNELTSSGAPDDVIAREFQKATLPSEILGDLRALISHVTTPLAIRSSSMLEDSLHQPFAGIYTTKMVPNNQPGPDARFQKLVEAIKLVYASTHFKPAREYIRATGLRPEDEKMAVLIQEVVGRRFGDRFYPQVSGVARSYNFYPVGAALREEGVVSLALGLGKTIVDGENCWTYAPSRPRSAPPFSSPGELLKQTQSRFWAVNMGKPPAYDPIHETEYLLHAPLSDAEDDGTLRGIASTYDAAADRIVQGTGTAGPRVVNFAGLLSWGEIPLNDTVKKLLGVCAGAVGHPVEIEFACTFDPPRLGFLQVRPMVVSDEEVDIAESDLSGPGTLVSSERALGNGVEQGLVDIVYVKPEPFEAKHTRAIANDLEAMNRQLTELGRRYVLIGFGRWGSSDPWLGIPVNWGQVSGARVIVEATLPSMNVELSQGAHFFHNLISFKVPYLSVPFTARSGINWSWLNDQPAVSETLFVRHVVVSSPLEVKVDGRSGRGMVTISNRENPRS